MNKIAKIISVFLAVNLMFSLALYAKASDRLEEGQEKGLIGKQTAEDRIFSQEKLAAVTRITEIRALYMCMDGQIPADYIDELENLLSAYYPDAELSNYLPGFAAQKQDTNGPKSNPGDGSYIHLHLPGQIQSYNYYCGPASGRAVLCGRGITVSQTVLAGLMNTTSNGTGLYYVAPALNNYNGIHANYFHYATLEGYQLTGENMTPQQWALLFTNTAITTLLGGYGVIYDCHQVQGSSNYLQGYGNSNNQANSSLYHYVAGEGFDSTTPSSRKCLYYDPNNNPALSLGDHHMMVTFQVMAVLCNDRGLIY